MANVGSLSGVFDLDTQAGITHLLASIRNGSISTEQKSELRDLVFLYTNGGKDQTVRIALEQKIVAYQLAPAAQKVAAQKLPPAPPIGTYRPAPSFQSPAAPAPAPQAGPDFAAAPAWQPTPTPPVAAPVAQPVPPQAAYIPVTSAPVQPAPVWTPPPAAPQQPPQWQQPVATPVEQPAPAYAPSTPPAPTAETQPAIAADDQQYLKRIREIKALVNEKVGNPVNLVDINNEVGREYMGALLDAMKKLNSGSSAASAMQRLETAFAAVNTAIEVHQKGGGSAAPAAPVPPPVVPSAPVVPVPHTTPPPVTEAPVILEESRVTEVGRLYNEVPRSTPVNVTPISAPTAAPQVPMEEATPWVSEVPKSAAQVVAPFTSLADAKEKPRNITELPTSASLKTATVAGDPLFTKEVDDGLQALLLEWPIFKKSGLFGSGPKGKDHPLFKKMAPLQIPLLLAGRFEGATQEIKQSVTDYMNGWRYEQGLIYQQGETFEHYLRRVIRHILDLQKGK